MALTNVTASGGSRQASAPMFPVEITADLDSNYIADGYPLNELGVTLDPDRVFPGVTVVWSPPVPHYDGVGVTRWVQLVDDSGTPKLRVYADAGGAPGAEEAGGTDLALHTGVTVGGMVQ